MLKSFRVLIIVFAILSFCGSKDGRRNSKIDNLEKLPFKLPGKSPNNQNSTPSNSDNKASDYRTHIDTLFRNDSLINISYGKFCEEISEAKKFNLLPQLFNDFFRSNVFYNIKKKDWPKHKKILTKFVASAKASEDEELRMLYSNFSMSFKAGDRLRRFSLNNTKIRPGEKLRLYSYYYNYHRKKLKKQKFYIDITRLTLDKHLKPTGFKFIRTDSLYIKKYDNQYDCKLDTGGIYRITVQNDIHFQQFFIQVSWLDGVVKTDKEKVLIFGSSFKDTLPPPYTIHCVSADGEIYNTKTDKNGLLALSHNLSSKQSGGYTKIILRKDNQLAFLEGYIPQDYIDTSLIYYLYTDRPVYRPGHKVYFRGMLKKFINDKEVGAACLDSFQLSIYDPQGSEVYNKSLPVDKWGHFGDSLSLSETAKQGAYSMQYRNIKNGPNNKSRIPSIREYQYFSFNVDAYKKPEFKIKVDSKKNNFIAGEKVVLDVSGEYYFGGALADVPLKVRWYKQNMYHYFGYWGNRRKCYFHPSGGRTLLKQEELKLNKEGKLVLSYLPEVSEEYSYIIAEVIATDQSRRQIRDEAKVKVVKHNAYVNIIMDKWNYEIGEKAEIEVVAVDLDGNTLKGAVQIRIKKSKEIVLDNTLDIAASGSARFEYDIKEKGNYIIEATVKDANGKSVYTERSFTAVKKKTWDWNWERLEISFDKEQYNVGDTVIATVKSGATDTKAFCTVEGTDIYNYDIKKIKEHSLEYHIPLSEEIGDELQIHIPEKVLLNLSDF